MRTTRNRSSVTPTSSMIREMTRAIVKQFDPERVILFGSHARGTSGPDSDVDLMVVMPADSVRAKAIEIGVALHPFGCPKDIVVVRPDDYAWRRNVVGTLEFPADKEGRVLYARG